MSGASLARWARRACARVRTCSTSCSTAPTCCSSAARPARPHGATAKGAAAKGTPAHSSPSAATLPHRRPARLHAQGCCPLGPGRSALALAAWLPEERLRRRLEGALPKGALPEAVDAAAVCVPPPGEACVTLGHGLLGDVVGHAYWGGGVLADLSRQPGWAQAQHSTRGAAARVVTGLQPVWYGAAPPDT